MRYIVIAIAPGLTALAFTLGLITDDTPTYAEIEHSIIEDTYLDDNEQEFGIRGAAATYEEYHAILPDQRTSSQPNTLPRRQSTHRLSLASNERSGAVLTVTSTTSSQPDLSRNVTLLDDTAKGPLELESTPAILGPTDNAGVED